MVNRDFTHQLQQLMQRVGVSSLKALSRAAGVSERQLLRLRRGEVEQMRVDTLIKLSQVLQISLSDLVAAFSDKQVDWRKSTPRETATVSQELLNEITDFKKEYHRLQTELEKQREALLQEFQQSSLQVVESLLLQFPTAAYRAQQDPQLAAVKIVPLVQKPLERLLQHWGVEAIAPVGAEIPYNPQWHQLMEGTVQPGELVKVRYTGYLQGEKLLSRVKVSPVGQ